jgi:hypothetical protein
MPTHAGTSFTILFIPNQPLSRQGISLDYVLVYPVDITVESCKKSQNSSKSHLFQKLKNTLIFKGEQTEGISPSAPPRTGHEPLSSSGSYHSNH